MFLAYVAKEAPKMTYTCLSALTLLLLSAIGNTFYGFHIFPWTTNDDASAAVIHGLFDLTVSRAAP